MRSTEGHKVILHKELLDSDPAGTITSKNPLLAQSQKWHALAQSHEKSKSARSVPLAGKSQGEPPIFGVRLEPVPREKRAGYVLSAVPTCSLVPVIGINIMIQQRGGRRP